MWGDTDLFLFTSNPVVNKQGLAVMGRGIAKQLADAQPDVRQHFGRVLSAPRPANVGVLGWYDWQMVGWFRVKDHFAQDAKTGIINASMLMLKALSPGFNRIDMNFPGIGNGKLAREDVLPIIEQLPDNVHVWELP